MGRSSRPVGRVTASSSSSAAARSTPAPPCPGGLTKGITEDERAEIERLGRWAVEFGQASLALFDRLVLGNPAYLELILGDVYRDETYYMGMVDPAGKVNFYDGRIRVVAPDGELHGEYAPAEYRDWIAERVEPWTYLKFPYLQQVGWKGFVDGKDSGIYCATPLSRLNAADGMATPLAQAEYERFYATLAPRAADGRKRLVHQRLATHWARLIELLYAAERWVELATRPGGRLGQRPNRAHRGADEGRRDRRGPAGDAHPPLLDRRARSPHPREPRRGDDEQLRADQPVGRQGRPQPDPPRERSTDGLLNRVEMAFRSYDPCFGCATHSLPGQMPLEVAIRDADGRVLDVRRQFC